MEHTNKRTLQAQKTKKKIYNTSVRLINERGYEGVTVDDICKECGISKGAFYHHFRSKLDIISHVEEMVNNSIIDALDECEDLHITEKILVFTNSLLSVAEKTGLEFTRQRTKYVVGGQYAKETGAAIFSVYSRVKMKEILSQAVDKGEMEKNTPVDTIMETIMKLTCGMIADWCIFDGEYSLTDTGWELTHFMISNILDKYILKRE